MFFRLIRLSVLLSLSELKEKSLIKKRTVSGMELFETLAIFLPLLVLHSFVPSLVDGEAYTVTVDCDSNKAPLKHFRESTGFCPPLPHKDYHKYVLSDNEYQNQGCAQRGFGRGSQNSGGGLGGSQNSVGGGGTAVSPPPPPAGSGVEPQKISKLMLSRGLQHLFP